MTTRDGLLPEHVHRRPDGQYVRISHSFTVKWKAVDGSFVERWFSSESARAKLLSDLMKRGIIYECYTTAHEQLVRP